MRQELSQYLSNLEHVRNRRPGTIYNHKKEISRFLDYLEEKNVEIENIDHTFIRKYLRTQYEKKFKSITMHSKISIIKSFFRYCHWKSFIKTNPATDIISPKLVRPLFSFLAEREMEKFLPFPILALRDYALLELLYATGIRGSELVGIDTDNISLKDKAILIRGRKRRYVFFGWKAARCLKYYLIPRRLLIDDADEEKALFLCYSGKRIGLRAVERIFERYWRLSGLAKKVTPRTFRHSFASHLLGQGAKSCFVQGLMGHKRLATTEKYLRIDIKHLKALHKKYHPRALEQPEKEIQTLEDITYSYTQCDLIRY